MIYPKPTNTNNYLACDLAISTKDTANYTVLAPFGVDPNDDMYFHPDLVRDRLDGLQIVERILDLAAKYQVQCIGIERGHISLALGPIFRKRMNERRQYYNFWEHAPTKDKQTYARSLQARMQQGKVYFPDTPDFRDTYIPELMAFPAGRNDDVVSAMSIAALMLDALVAPAPPPDLPETGPGPLTFEKLIEPLHKSGANRHQRHVPQKLFGHRKKK